MWSGWIKMTIASVKGDIARVLEWVWGNKEINDGSVGGVGIV